MVPGLVPVISQVRAPVHVLAGVLCLVMLATACGPAPTTVESTIVSRDHEVPSSCGASFVAHDLEHTTSGPGNTASTFDGTGAGVGVADLNGDGRLDIVLANLSGTSSVLENLGGLEFRRHELEPARFRGVAIVDVTNDGAPDIVMTTGIGPPVLFSNPGNGDMGAFTRVRLEGIRAATYSMAWTDLSGDGDLDVITGSYNAELTLLRNTPVIGPDTGVVLHERTTDGFVIERLSETAQALALVTTDTNNDGRFDILVGNDLATPDMLWLATDDGVEPAQPFSTSTYSTMSYDSADIDNDGQTELFATDMKPAEPDDRYREVERDLAAAPVVDDIQIPENVLIDTGETNWPNEAAGQPFSATGWSWSGLFGDLDNDGLQDLYIATGMRSEPLFNFLPEARLVEKNQAFRNIDGALVPEPDWGLAATEGGRGMAMADLDTDGDLDIVLNNLDTAARLFENTQCGTSVTVELEWSGMQNISALGARVAASSGGVTRTREITSSRGYLSSGPPIAHIGVGDADAVDLVVTWPDGTTTEHLDVPTATHITITR